MMNKKSKTHTMDNVLNSHVGCRLHHTILLLNRQIHRPLQGYNTLVVVDDPLSRLVELNTYLRTSPHFLNICNQNTILHEMPI